MQRYDRYALTASSVAVVLTTAFRYIPGLADGYREHIFLPVSAWARRYTGATSLPLAEIWMIAGCAMLAASMIRLMIRLNTVKLRQWFGKMMCIISTAVLAYTVLWAPLYYCTSAFEEAIETVGLLEAFCGELIDSLNGLADRFELPDLQTVNAEAAGLVSDECGVWLSAPKTVRYPEAFSAVGIAGIYVPFTFESLLNPNDIAPALPFTACHELAHQAGYAREEEANFVAWLACRKGGSYFRYSGDFTMLTSAMARLRALDGEVWEECVERMSPALLYDFRSANGLGEAAENASHQRRAWISDVFLRMNGQKSGLESYDRSVLLAMGYFERNGMRLTF